MLKAFQSLPFSSEINEKIDYIREHFFFLCEKLEEACPASRERSVAITELESAFMWAIKSITHNQ